MNDVQSLNKASVDSIQFDSTPESKALLLRLAEELKSISAACRKMSVARSTFYEIKKAYDDLGVKGLEPKRKGILGKPKPTSSEQEAIVLQYTKKYPTYSYIKLEETLKQDGQDIRAGHIRVVWRKNRLNRRSERILWANRG